MSKKVLVVFLAMTLFSVSAFAESKKKAKKVAAPTEAIEDSKKDSGPFEHKKFGMAGCGLGSMVFGSKKGIVEQVVAATLNGTSGNQTFGISTGTSNCTPESADASGTASLYITVNQEALAKDSARGEGESINNLASILGCSDAKTLGSELKKNYSDVFSAEGDRLTQKMLSVLRSNQKISRTCPKVG